VVRFYPGNVFTAARRPILHNHFRPMTEPSILVACLCAEWCGVCREYRSVFDQVRQRIPSARFIWVDVEDQSDLVDPLEVDDFPTLLIASDAEVRFFGPMIPRADRLERMVREQIAPGPIGDQPGSGKAFAPDVLAIFDRLRASAR
jgi:thioredoxin 1